MNHFRVTMILAILLCAGSAAAAAGAAIGEAAARKVCDAFMSDLIANNIPAAADMMEPEYIRHFGRAETEARMRKFYDDCGLPLDKELVDEQNGVKSYPDGRKKPLKTLYYSATTTKYIKGNCWFSVAVVPTPVGLRVSEYGAVHQFAGEI